mmetsp:Transcript_26676/g.67044  ORF Transcript_26676/g.67044 Transcript_26676/m.67044 type:complete len:129 (-) Transcript_26676:862-1248(-)|eukprot:CAMPEP_0177658942 /NCGR_PEP_ID=MMETSP0447-20121125/17149_1 /TAXON_ID=0 /ORGANISM="Stygamoeba regulata, Strain BSH-02190019" /LENGTH=128 /DNA_ID=CAMNT_0019163721 /DNA_START=255 /DNA_END=641 /DNA_ORIENTATION=+
MNMGNMHNPNQAMTGINQFGVGRIGGGPMGGTNFGGAFAGSNPITRTGLDGWGKWGYRGLAPPTTHDVPVTALLQDFERPYIYIFEKELLFTVDELLLLAPEHWRKLELPLGLELRLKNKLSQLRKQA